MALKLDVSKFKKVKSDQKSTTLRHPDGHEIVVAHAALSPAHRKDLQALPMSEAEAPPQQQSTQMLAKGGKVMVQKFAGGTPDGTVANSDSAQDSPDQSASDAQAQSSAPPPPQQPGVNININSGGNAPQQPTQADAAQAIGSGVGGAIRTGVGAVGKAIYDSRIAPIQHGVQGLMQGLSGQQPDAAAPASPAPAQAPITDANGLAAGASPNSAAPTGDAQQLPAQQDPYGANAAYDTYTKGLGQSLGGVQAEAAAIGHEGNVQNKVLQQSIEAQRDIQSNVQDQIKQNSDEYHNFIQDIQNQHIDPNQFLNTMGVAGKIKTGIGLILGGIGGGLTHQGNPALDFLNAQINRDIEGQKMQLGQKQGLLAANIQHFGNIRDGVAMTTAMQQGVVANQLKQAAAQAMDPMAKARAMQQAGALEMQASQTIGQLGMRRGMMASMQGAGAQNPDAYLNAMRWLNPEMAKDIESRTVPGVGTGSIPIPTEARGEMVARQNLANQVTKLEQFAKTHSGDLSPTDMNYGHALANNVQDAYRQANKQGVFREAEAQFVNKSISADPTEFLNKYRALPGYKAVAQTNRATLNNMYNSYGIKVPQIQESAPNLPPKK